MSHRKILAAAALAVALTGCAGAQERTPAAELETFASAEGGFSVSVPVGWERNGRFPYAIDDAVHGVMLEGPKGEGGAAVKIAVLRYAGTGTIDGADEYIRMVLFNPTRLDADTEPELEPIEAAGIEGRSFGFTKFELVILPHKPPDPPPGVIYEVRPPTRQVTMKVRYVVLPAGRGFWSLRYEAPEDLVAEYTPLFEAVVASFKTLSK